MDAGREMRLRLAAIVISVSVVAQIRNVTAEVGWKDGRQ